MSKNTLQTAIAVANSMIGTAMIVFPLNYLNEGIIQNLIFLVLMGSILAITCSVYGVHLRPDQKDITVTIKRILGDNFFKAAALMSGIIVTLVSSVFFLLASDILYDVIMDLSGAGDGFFLSEKAFKFILMCGFVFMTFLKNLEIVFKASPYALFSLILSTLVLIFSLPYNWDNIDKGAIQPKEISLKGLLTVVSINGFAFTCHPSISPMLKANQNPANNRKAILLGFSITCFLYLVVGVGGSLAIYGIHPEKTSNVMDYFVGKWQAPVIGFTNFVYFFMIFPIFPFVGKSQLVSLIPKQINSKQNFSLKIAIAYGIVWLVLNSFFIGADTNAGVVMGFLGSVVSFYFTYLMPVMMMYKAGNNIIIDKNSHTNDDNEIIISNKNKNQNQNRRGIQESLLTSQDVQQGLQRQQSGSDSLLPSSSVTKSNETNHEANQGTNLNAKITDQQQQKNQQKQYIFEETPLTIKQKVLYGAILIFGSVLFISELVGIISDFF